MNEEIAGLQAQIATLGVAKKEAEKINDISKQGQINAEITALTAKEEMFKKDAQELKDLKIGEK